MTELEAGLEAVLFAAGDAVPVDRLAPPPRPTRRARGVGGGGPGFRWRPRASGAPRGATARWAASSSGVPRSIRAAA